MKIPKFDLTDRVAIITGATKGLGYATAITFASYGAHIVVASRTVADCDRVAAEIEAMGVKALSCPTDVSKLDQIDNLVEKTMEKFGKIDILVNNAGIGITRLARDMTEEEWDEVVDIDLKGVFFTAQRVAKVMAQQKYGNIINIGSLGGIIASSRMMPYMASKSAVLHITKGMVLEWARYNIRVNAIAPGYILTPMTKETLENEKAYHAIADPVPHMRKIGDPEDIAACALFLASDCSDFVMGHTLVCDGGRSVY